MTAALFTSQLKNWNKSQPQIRKSLMFEFKGIKQTTCIELMQNAQSIETNLDKALLNAAVLLEFIKLSIND